MSITIKSNPDGVTGAIQVNGVDKVTIGASGITAGSFAPNSIDAAAAALAFSGANQSLASSGYQKLPSGLIIQWGQAVSSSSAALLVTLPVAFPNGALRAFSTPTDTVFSNMSAAEPISVSQIKVSAWIVSGGSTVRTATQVQWFAIGY